MNRAQFALDLLQKHGTVTMAMIADNWPERVYCFRNSISECKKLLPAGCQIVAHIKGEWKDHAYTLHRPAAGQASFDFTGTPSVRFASGTVSRQMTNG